MHTYPAQARIKMNAKKKILVSIDDLD